MLLFDLTAAQGYGSTKQHGGGKYAEIVFEALCKKTSNIVCMWDSKRWISDDLLELCERNSLIKEDVAVLSVDEIVKKHNISLIYSALPSDELLSYKGCKILVTLHGLRALEIPYDMMMLCYPIPLIDKIKLIIKRVLPKARTDRGSLAYYGKFFNNDKLSFVTVSKHTKYAIETYFPYINRDRIKVFYSPSTSYPIEAERKPQAKSYFLIVSANRLEKNALRAIIAIDRLFASGKMQNYRVKVTGVSSNVFRYKLQCPKHFDFYGYVSEEQLNELYGNAYALVYPSFTEGFGYPPLEAMRYGVPVLASPFTSITEVCGDAALYCNPYSIEEMMNRVLQITDININKEYESKALLRYKFIKDKQNRDLDLLTDYIISKISRN